MISKSYRMRPVPTGLAFAGLPACAEGSGSFALRTSGYVALHFVSLGTGIRSVGSVVCCWWQLHLKMIWDKYDTCYTIFIKSWLATNNIKDLKVARLRPVPTGLAFAGLAACAEGFGSCTLRTSGYLTLDVAPLGMGIGSVGSVVCHLENIWDL